MITIVPYDPAWLEEFATIARELRSALGPDALRIDHIGSTAVPGLSAKDIVDIQVTVAALEPFDRQAAALAGAGFETRPELWTDHLPPGVTGPASDWQKRMVKPGPHGRAANIHVRVAGRPNQRYALLFRDFLRAHPRSATAYAELKRRLALHLGEIRDYAEVKDPACDLIIEAAEAWAAHTNWSPGASDA